MRANKPGGKRAHCRAMPAVLSTVDGKPPFLEDKRPYDAFGMQAARFLEQRALQSELEILFPTYRGQSQ